MSAVKGNPVTAAELLSILRQSPGGVVIPCRVQPGTSEERVVGILDGALKIALKAPPVEGKANAALQKFLAAKLRCAKSAVRLVSGDTSRHKSIEIRGVSPESVVAALAAL